MNTTPTPGTPLPASVLNTLERGDTIEAIKLLRSATGLGLKEAKDVVDAHARGVGRQALPSPSTKNLPANVIAALQRGEKIEAIKLLREATGLGLKEAKDAVESALSPPSRADKVRRAPGEVPRSNILLCLIVCLAVAGAVAYYFLRAAG